MPLEHQVAQKIHALTGGGDRVRDLVDLQIVFANSEVVLHATRRVCERLFAYRQAQAWPPAITPREGWAEQCPAQAEGLPVRQDLGGAAG